MNDQLVDILVKTCVIQDGIAPGECSWIVPPHTPGSRGGIHLSPRGRGEVFIF